MLISTFRDRGKLWLRLLRNTALPASISLRPRTVVPSRARFSTMRLAIRFRSQNVMVENTAIGTSTDAEGNSRCATSRRGGRH